MGKKQDKKKKKEESASDSTLEDGNVEMTHVGQSKEHLVEKKKKKKHSKTKKTKTDGDAKIDIVDDAPEETENEEPYHPDSVYTSIDGLRSIAVFLMVVRTFIARFTYGANPLLKAFGGDWLPPVFLYASGARLVAEQEGLRASLDALNDKPAARRRLLWESAVKYYASTITMFIIAYVFVIASFGPSHACAWDVLVPLGIANMIMYPINLHMRRFQWVLLIPAILLHIFYPVFFHLMDGYTFFDQGGAFIPNWTAKGVLGNLFITGYCPLLGLLPFELTGMVFSHYMLVDKKATPQRKAAFGFFSLLVIMIGFELKYFSDQLQPSDEIVNNYIFVNWTSLPFSLSMALLLEGCFGIEFATLSTIFDPLGKTVSGPASPRPRDTFMIREFFRESSLSAVSLYIFHAVILNVIVRATSYVQTSSGDTYMYYTPIWPYATWIGDFLFGTAGFLYFVMWEVIFHFWFTRGKGIGTTEWVMGLGANLGWKLISCCCCCCFSSKDAIPDEDEESAKNKKTEENEKKQEKEKKVEEIDDDDDDNEEEDDDDEDSE